jgi:4-aminobutyrate aminotransferase-like enzyme
MSPPLNIAKTDVDEAIHIMDEALSAVQQPAVAAAR